MNDPTPPAHKDQLRERHWDALVASGDALPPGAHGRIPNFRGAEGAAQRLTESPAWQTARALKCNPDTPQRAVRAAALRSGKTVYLAVPKLQADKPFIRLDPARIPSDKYWDAVTPAGAELLGRPVRVDEVGTIDLIVTGCVAVTPSGARLGKGGGYSDLEFALLREAGKLSEHTPIITTVHPTQVAEDGELPMLPHDISLDWYATPQQLVRCPRSFARPAGIERPALQPSQRESIPALGRALSRGAAGPPSLSELKTRFSSIGRVAFIGLRPAQGVAMQIVASVHALAERGLEGDRSAGRPGGERQVSLFQLEHLPALASYLGRSSVPPELLRRNLGVSGINLLALKDQLFTIGSVRLQGTGPCAPCRRLEATLGEGGFNAARGHGGITARILTEGTLRVGDEVRWG